VNSHRVHVGLLPCRLQATLNKSLENSNPETYAGEVGLALGGSLLATKSVACLFCPLVWLGLVLLHITCVHFHASYKARHSEVDALYACALADAVACFSAITGAGSMLINDYFDYRAGPLLSIPFPHVFCVNSWGG
jgi:hypothetical protein